MTHPCSLSRLDLAISSCVLKVDELDFDVGIEGVLFEENRAACTMGYVEPTCENVMIDILRCLLQGNNMSPACNLLFEGIFFPAQVPRVPVVDAERLLHRGTSSNMFVDTVCLSRCSRPPF